MSAKPWPKIKEVMWKGAKMLQVDARIAGRGERRLFSGKKQAETWAQIQRVKRENQGNRAFDDSELAEFGWNIQDAIRFALAHLRRSKASATIESAMQSLIEAKRAAGRSARYCNDLGLRLEGSARLSREKPLRS